MVKEGKKKRLHREMVPG